MTEKAAPKDAPLPNEAATLEEAAPTAEPDAGAPEAAVAQEAPEQGPTDAAVEIPPEPAAATQPEPTPEKIEPAVPPSGSTKEVLDNLMIPLAIELSRVNMSTVQIAALKSGTLIELSRGPGEPVDLVVGGKSIGKGELVNIEGELGIRILSLVR